MLASTLLDCASVVMDRRKFGEAPGGALATTNTWPVGRPWAFEARVTLTLGVQPCAAGRASGVASAPPADATSQTTLRASNSPQPTPSRRSPLPPPSAPPAAFRACAVYATAIEGARPAYLRPVRFRQSVVRPHGYLQENCDAVRGDVGHAVRTPVAGWVGGARRPATCSA